MSRKARVIANTPNITMPWRSPSRSGPSITAATMRGSATWKADDMMEVTMITAMWTRYGRRYDRARHKARRFRPPRRMGRSSQAFAPPHDPICAGFRELEAISGRMCLLLPREAKCRAERGTDGLDQFERGFGVDVVAQRLLAQQQGEHH